MRRYEIFCRKLILERHYSAAAFITSSVDDGIHGVYKSPATDLSLERFVKVIAAHAATCL